MGPPRTCVLLLILAISDMTFAACSKQKLLEDILSPANAERALQILRLASVGANKVGPSGPSLLDGLSRFLPNSNPKQLLSDAYPRLLPSLPLPRSVINQPIIEVLPDLYPPIINPSIIQEKVYPGVPIPKPCVEYAPAPPVAYPGPPVAYPAAPVGYPGPPVAPVGYPAPPVAPCPYPPAPVPLVNPFLPAASPVSAMAPPTSSLLPPVVPSQVRSNFLRKIPIPPPYL